MRYRKMHGAVACGVEMKATGSVVCGVSGFGEAVSVSAARGLGGDGVVIRNRARGLGIEEKFGVADHDSGQNVMALAKSGEIIEESAERLVGNVDGSRETLLSGLSENQGMSNLVVPGDDKDECSGLNLMVDLNWFGAGEEDDVKLASVVDRVEEIVELKSGNEERVVPQFGVSDLVWGKVRSHPWWPGQIIDPSAASAEAKKYFKNGSFLIAYFGDQTFAWNQAVSIKPFADCFSRMKKQSSSQDFCGAVDCALAEMSRRVEYGLACSCLPKEIIDKISFQTMINAGIVNGTVDAVGKDGSLSSASFKPMMLVEYVKGLAKSPLAENGTLDFVMNQARLLALSRWRGYPELPEVVVMDGLWKDEEGKTINLSSEGKSHGVMESVLLTNSDASGGVSDASGKRKRKGRGTLLPSQKEKCLSNLMVDKHSFSRKKNKTQSAPSGDSAKGGGELMVKGGDGKSPRQTLLPEVGEKIMKIARAMKCSGMGSMSHKSKAYSGRIYSVVEHKSLDEMMGYLYSVAQDPGNCYQALAPVIGFFSEFRDFCIPVQDPDGGNVKSIMSCVTGESLDSEYMRDSYWTDRIIESIPDEQTEMEVDIAAETVKSEKINSPPTALILKFNKADLIPPEPKLNKIFDRFGPLHESETKIFKKTKRAKVVFKKLVDAEAAFSSAGKYSIFGPSLVSYRLKYEPAKRCSGASIYPREQS